jgi:hypothetical protein
LGPAESGNKAEVDFRLTQSRLVAGDAQMTGHRQFHAATECETLQARNDRFAEAFDPRHQLLPVARELLRLQWCHSGQFADIGAGDECLFAAAAQDDNANGVIVGSLIESDVQLADRFLVERVELVWPVYGDAAHGATIFEEQVAEGHGRYPGQ